MLDIFPWERSRNGLMCVHDQPFWFIVHANQTFLDSFPWETTHFGIAPTGDPLGNQPIWLVILYAHLPILQLHSWAQKGQHCAKKSIPVPILSAIFCTVLVFWCSIRLLSDDIKFLPPRFGPAIIPWYSSQ